MPGNSETEQRRRRPTGGKANMDATSFDAVKKRIDAIVIQSEYTEEPFHSLNTHEWLLRLDPEADRGLQIAALGHDIERSLPERKVLARNYDSFDFFMLAHAENSAQILSEIMTECGLPEGEVDDIAFLVANHETGSGDRIDLLINADVLSFFHVSLPFYYDRRGAETTKRRLVWNYKRLSPGLRYHVSEIDFVDEELRALVDEAVGLDD